MRSASWTETSLRALDFVAAILILWVLGGFLLEGTAWQRFSARTIEEAYGCGLVMFGLSGFIVVALLLLSMILAVWHPGLAGTDRSRLWYLTVATLVLYGAMIVRHANDEMGITCSMMVTSFSFGMLAARLAPSSVVAYCLCFLVAVEAAYAVFYYFTGSHQLMSGTVERAMGTYYGRSAVYVAFVATIPVALALAVGEKSGALRAGVIVTTALLAIALVLTCYRGGIFAVTASVLLFLHRGGLRRRVVIPIALALLAMNIGVFSVRSAGRVNSASASLSVASRPRAWHQGWRVFASHWQAGVGASEALIELDVTQHGKVVRSVSSQPFNTVLYWLDTFGVTGGALLLCLGASVFGLLVKRQSIIATGVLCAWVGLVVAGIGDTTVALTDRLPIDTILGVLLGLTLRTKNDSTAVGVDVSPQRDNADSQAVSVS